MYYDLSEIKKIRKSLGLTQAELSKKADVSQSLIAKIEAGKIDPTYTKTKQVFETLDSLGKKEELKADQFMSRKIVSVTPSESIRSSISKMKRLGISQMPVISGHNVVGYISESILLEALMNEKHDKVSEIMEEAPPTVSRNASIGVASNLLKHYPMILVTNSGKLSGIITKSDLLGKLYRG